MPAPDRSRWRRSGERRRAAVLRLTTAGCIMLVAWSIYLGLTLPGSYDSHHWRLVWVGYDVIMAISLGATAYLAWKRRLLVILTGTVSGTMLLVDAWFDICTASDPDLSQSIAAAVLLEVPSGLLLIAAATSLLHRIIQHLTAVTGTPWWRTLVAPEDRE